MVLVSRAPTLELLRVGCPLISQLGGDTGTWRSHTARAAGADDFRKQGLSAKQSAHWLTGACAPIISENSVKDYVSILTLLLNKMFNMCSFSELVSNILNQQLTADETC